MRLSRRTSTIAGAAALALAASACGSDDGAAGGTENDGDAEGGYVIGVSNTLAGNGWREQMVCSIQAEALASGQVDRVVVMSENAGPTEQVQHLQTLISEGVDAIVVNPSDPEQLNGIIEEASAQGIVVVAIDAAVTTEEAYVVTNDQVEWGRIGMEWLAEEIGGQGEVLYMRGIEGVQSDTDRHEGVTAALESYPDIELTTVWSNWDYTLGGELAVQQFSAGDYDGVWTTGADYTVVNGIETAGKELVPVTGQDSNAFVGQLMEGAPGAVVTNPAVIGAVGTNVALQVLGGEDVEQTTMLTPELWTTDDSAEQLEAAYDPERGPDTSAAVEIDYPLEMTREQLYACEGPSGS
ncbi:monosaccharide ABC transporter substrate-binding protein, CUT2 family [Georgenia satyanarayanai]|uniref:Monosaccharide ABC transporter substrate-binding protein, CUT2 family n=1 Tax=Georgenia satyanarayanai TaxID=860221 RepID=A0A2Y9A2H7_9MICO|nr:substrate-binding domain-containing protein [Georgenia satyanarayanai]PYG01906.1 monosaccharide ABC transporter substrate-binding protein (CUT2 family) [Georgenia satyanarayanai]SSA36709.1 monosaccharide ABC transporter substrate-binding protein, CUT2 family [Georgenia satyanarayanai]